MADPQLENGLKAPQMSETCSSSPHGSLQQATVYTQLIGCVAQP